MANDGPLEASVAGAAGVSREILAGDASGLGGREVGFKEEEEEEEEFSLPAALGRGEEWDRLRR